MLKSRIFCAVLAIFLNATGAAFAASEINESELNHPVGNPQRVDVPNGELVIKGVIGYVVGTPGDDLDFYSFWGKEGDLVTLDIDGGIGGMKNVDTIIAVFGTGPGFPML